MDAKSHLEMHNLQKLPEFANLDEKALEFMNAKARLTFGEREEVRLTEAELRELRRREEIQKRLLDQPLDVSLFRQARADARPGHGLSELCTVSINGGKERVLRLTEVFLPTKADEKVRRMMDAFNRVKMPHLKNSLDEHVLEQRKRTIKAELKQANEKARLLQSKVANGLYRPNQTEADFLLQEGVSRRDLELMSSRRSANVSLLPDLQGERSKKQKVVPLQVLAKRKRKDISEEAQARQLAAVVDQPGAEASKLQLISINQKSSIMQRVEANLEQIERLKQRLCDPQKVEAEKELARKMIGVNQKISTLRCEREQASEADLPPLLSMLTEDERATLRAKFGEAHHKSMDRSLPSGVQGMTETEKKCFEFVQSLQFESCYYTIDGQASRVKSQFNAEKSPNILGDIIGQMQGGQAQRAKAVGITDGALQTSFFGRFISNREGILPSKAQEEAEEYCLMSQSNSGDEGMVPPSSDEEALSFGAESEPKSRRKAESKQRRRDSQDEISKDFLEPASRLQRGDGRPTRATRPPEFYHSVERDSRIRDIMISRKFAHLRRANADSGVSVLRLGKVDRKKYWGELPSMDSQMQINRDFVKYKHQEARLPSQPLRREFQIEHAAPNVNDDRAVGQFKTKYGSLSLSGAHPNITFKIDDLDEYEFVQRQRAFLYDPLHIKGSTQFKGFSTLVGLEGLSWTTGDANKIQKTFDRNQAIQGLLQDMSAAKQPRQGRESYVPQLAQTPAIKEVLSLMNPPVEGDKEEDLEATKGTAEGPAHLLAVNDQGKLFADPRKQKLQRLHHEILQSVTDDFDQLTNAVRVKKLEEYIRRKKHEELTRNLTNDKKNQSTAYRPTNLPVPQPMQSQGNKSDEVMATGEGNTINQSTQGAIDAGRQDDSENDEVPKTSSPALKAEARDEDLNDAEADDNMAGSEASEIEAVGGDVLDSNLTQEASHAKCILDLSFTKFKWNINEDFSRFHRPDIQEHFDREREVLKVVHDQEDLLGTEGTIAQQNQTISIDASGALHRHPGGRDSGEEGQSDFKSVRPVGLPVQVIDRDLIKRKNKKRGIINADEYFKDRFKLSLKDGKFCIFEHVDENPIFVNNFGMVSKLYRFLYNDRTIPNDEFLPKNKNAKLMHMGPYGLQILKNQNSKLPLLGNVDKTMFQGIAVLSNKLYRAPVFYHKPRQTDFFCSVFQDKRGSRQIILREIQDIYSVGQLEPLLPVYNPQSRYYQQYIKQHSKAYIIRFLQENNNRLDFREIQHLFSYLTDQMLKKFIKEISVEVNRDQVCSSTRQLSDETIKNLITPEMICQYESALYGEAMLRQRGIENITNADKISYASNKYSSEQRDPERQRISKFIENEVLCTPWNLSQNFVTINQSGGMLMIRGVGDPSNNNGGFSFLKMPLKISNDSLKDSMKIRMDLNPAIQNPKSVTGTDADLRRLKKQDIFNKLVEMGYDVKFIQKMARWSMVGLLRMHSSNLQGGVQGDDRNKKYARGIRYTSKTQREVYHKQVDSLFKTQMIYLTGRKMLNDESDHEDPCAALNIPANNLRDRPQTLDSDNDEEGVYAGHNGLKKYIVEILDQDRIKALTHEQADLSPKFGSSYLNPDFAPSSGSIKEIADIPNYKKLLLATVPLQSQTIQTGAQIGLINIGGNSGNHQDSFVNSKNAEQMLDEKLENKEMTLKCRVLKKVIKSEDQEGAVERIEFNSDPKVIKKFIKRQQKCKTKKDRARKTGLREKMLQNQQLAESKVEFKAPLPPNHDKLLSGGGIEAGFGGQNLQGMLEKSLDDQNSSGNLIKISMDEFEDPVNHPNRFGKNFNRKGGKQSKIIDLKKLGGQTNIDQLLQRNEATSSNQQQVFNLADIMKGPSHAAQAGRASQSLRMGSKRSASLIKGQRAMAANNTITIPNSLAEDGDKIVIPMDDGGDQQEERSYDTGNDDQFVDFSGQRQHENNNFISLDMVGDSNKISIGLTRGNRGDVEQGNEQGGYDEQDYNQEDDYERYDDTSFNLDESNFDGAPSRRSKKLGSSKRREPLPKLSKREKPKKVPKATKAENRHNQRFMESYLQDMEQTRKQHQMLSTSRRSKLTGESVLNKAIEGITRELFQHDHHNTFRYPVDKKLALGYYQTITKPICIEEMCQRARRQEYGSIQEFFEDMELMRNNAIQFNGPVNPIADLATELRTRAQDLAAQPDYAAQIEEASEKIRLNPFTR